MCLDKVLDVKMGTHVSEFFLFWAGDVCGFDRINYIRSDDLAAIIYATIRRHVFEFFILDR